MAISRSQMRQQISKPPQKKKLTRKKELEQFKATKENQRARYLHVNKSAV